MPLRNLSVREGDALVGVVRRTRVSLGTEGGADAAGLTPDGVRAVFSEEDASPVADEHRAGKVVDRAVAFAKPNMRRTTKVRYRKWRAPTTGDKMASRHGQKGVIGFLLPPEDMPYSADGLVPDIIVNPHAFPSRMTLGHLMESLGAKAACMTGAKADGTMFEPFDTGASARTLGEFGFHPGGEEVLYCGRTGRALGGSVFVGPTYYQRLKQVVEDKINYRGSRGPVTAISRQPSQGRRNGGGQRLGEMEMDSIKAHGVASFLAESVTTRSDGTSVWTDGGGIPASFNEREDRFASLADPEDTVFEKRLVPRAFVTLVHELHGMGVDVRLMSHEAPE
jgi:DNA-directed RNA polymerase beta subunit